MAPFDYDIDDPENIRRFREYMETSKKEAKAVSPMSSKVQAAVTVAAPTETEVKPNVHHGQHSAEPLFNPYTARIPQEFRKVPSPAGTPNPGFFVDQPCPSPHVGGLTAPLNAPQAKASIFRPYVGHDHDLDIDEHVSLSESIAEASEASKASAQLKGIDKKGLDSSLDTAEVTSPDSPQSAQINSKGQPHNVSSMNPPSMHVKLSHNSMASKTGQNKSRLSPGTENAITVTDFTSPSKKSSVPPHLQGTGLVNQSNKDMNTSAKNTIKPLQKPTSDPTKTVSNISPTPSTMPLQEGPHITEHDSGATTQSAESIEATARALTLLHFHAIEATGFLSAKALALLHQVRDSIVAPSTKNKAATKAFTANIHKEQTPLRDISNLTEIQQDPQAPNDPLKSEADPNSSAAKGKTTITELPTKTSSPTNARGTDTKSTLREPKPKLTAPATTLTANNDDPAKVRKVIITDLPSNASVTTVAGLVFGGPLEEIILRTSASGTQTANVRFMDAQDCQKYYDETSNGVVYGKDPAGRELVSFVKLAQDVDVVGGMLRTWIEQGATRCVRTVGVDEDWGIEGLKKHAEQKGRVLEGITEGTTSGGSRAVTWRFCKIDHAVTFKAHLARDEDWEHVNIQFVADPCAVATGVHLDP